MKNTKILITSGAGFIGSNLVESFLKNGNEVICLDNMSTGHRKNIVDFLDNPNFQFTEGDIRDLDTCKKVRKVLKYDQKYDKEVDILYIQFSETFVPNIS